MSEIEHWFCPGCGEIDGPRAGMICHGPGFTGGCASVRNEVVEISHDAAQRLGEAVPTDAAAVGRMVALLSRYGWAREVREALVGDLLDAARDIPSGPGEATG